MAKISNIIQRRELEPLLRKAEKVGKHYEKANNCTAIVIGPDMDDPGKIFFPCKQCKARTAGTGGTKDCSLFHKDAINEARRRRDSYIYVCPDSFIFWTSPFYSGERFAGALISGGIIKSEKNNEKVKALANLMLLCAKQISSISSSQKNIISSLKHEFTTKTIQPASVFEKEKETYQIDMERKMLAGFRRGDNIEAGKILVNLLDTLYNETRGNMPVFRLKAMELAVLLSRSVSNPGDVNEETVLDTNIRYLKKIEESANLQEITEILSAITDKISEKIFSFHGVRHFSALRKAERYIWENYTRKISLREIADVSGLSAPYFSTIFKEEMGENLSGYLNRLRVERAAAMLLTTNLSISGIASACGFEDQSWFSKIFKNNTGYTPGKYRDCGITSGSLYNKGNIFGLTV
jgi:AraC-like DNA-binding protein/ligand-binding sensor protein